ncbi:sigma-70 family RNA polymerase sigma factor [Melittangium boletus]|uniref:RNA polymerase sigma factor n=1 Tax=Melittangium boletus TaxID=83453 RepID=UPI003DA4FFD1
MWVALALAAFLLYVAIPIGGLLFLSSVVLGFFWAQDRLVHVGALEPGAFSGALHLCGALLLVGAAFLLGMAAWNLLRRLAGETRPLPFLLRRPWWALGLFLLLACRFVVPTRPGASGAPGFAGAFVLATAVWAICCIGHLLWKSTWGGLAVAWRLARASPFGAGLLTMGAVACVSVMLSLSAPVDKLASRVAAKPGPWPKSCGPSSVECTRQLFLAGSRTSNSPSPSRRLQSASTGFSSTDWNMASGLPEVTGPRRLEAPESARDLRTRECLESQYKNRDLMEKGWRLAAALVNTTDAWDIVHATLLSVCLHPGERYDFEQFFLRSIRYGAYNWYRSPGNARTCPLDTTHEPRCDIRPDDEYVRSETQSAVKAALCALSNDDQQMLRLRYFDELSDQEIAERLRISSTAARKRLQRAREKFGEEFRLRCQ